MALPPRSTSLAFSSEAFFKLLQSASLTIPEDFHSSLLFLSLLLLHNCQAKLEGVCEQLEDTGASSPDADHCLLQTQSCLAS